MKTPRFFAFACTAFLAACGLWAQFPLNPNPSRVLGHRQLLLSNANPNLVEGRELYNPQALAIDAGAAPPALYVADTLNNRVLAWKDATQFSNGAPADLVIGQRDRYTTFAQGPSGTGSISTGLNTPTGLAVKDGDLYVADSGNNRIIRYPKPFAGGDESPTVIGQPNLNSRAANQGNGNPTERTLRLNFLRAGLVFDSSGNLWATDPGNNRVLRYPASAINARTNGPAADLMLGQVDFTSVATPLPTADASRQIKDRLQLPDSLAFDSAGRLYASDGLARVLVFTPPLFSGKPAARVMGVVLTPKQGDPPVPQLTINRTFMDPRGIFMAGNSPAVLDVNGNRILQFDPYDQWPDEATSYSPMARAVVGQNGDFTNLKSNNGQPEPSGATFSVPTAAVMLGDELFLADSGNNRVVVLPFKGGVFDPATRVLGQTEMAFRSPNLIEGREFQFTISSLNVADAAMVLDTKSDPPRLYVADVYNNRVLGFRDARRVRPGDAADLVIGQPDMFRGVCNYPNGDVNNPTSSSLCLYRTVPPNNTFLGGSALAVDDEGNLYVADSGNGRVLRFPSPFQNQATLPQADLVLGQTSFTSSIFDPSARTMGAPSGLAVAGSHGLLVADQLHNRVLLFPRVNGGFTSGMAATKVLGQSDFTSVAPGSDDNRMNSPHHLATDTDGRPYVVDTSNNRVLIFDTLGAVPNAGAHAVISLSGLSSPRGIYVNPSTGEIWATHTNAAQALRFPRFDQLPINDYKPNYVIAARSATLAVAQDPFGNLFIADATNRIAIHYPGLTAMNAANFDTSRPLAPGMVATLKPAGARFGDLTLSHEELPNKFPLPLELADIQVLVNDVAAPMQYVSPGQINMVVPSGTPVGDTADFTVMRKSAGQILASGSVQMNTASPGLFMGVGKQAAAINQDGSVNTPTNPVGRGSIISLFGTGIGALTGAPPDGDVAPGPTPTPEAPRVFIEPCYVDESSCESKGVQYSGLAPGMVGVWQINVYVPMTSLPGTARSVFVTYRNIPSNAVTIAIKQ